MKPHGLRQEIRRYRERVPLRRVNYWSPSSSAVTAPAAPAAFGGSRALWDCLEDFWCARDAARILEAGPGFLGRRRRWMREAAAMLDGVAQKWNTELLLTGTTPSTELYAMAMRCYKASDPARHEKVGEHDSRQ